MKADRDKLTPKQEKTLVALLRFGEIKAAAEDAGVAEVTLHRWLKDEVFKTAYRAGRRELVDVAISGLQADAQVARTVLRKIAEDVGASAAARVTAARTILEHSVAAVAVTDLLERIERLEKQTQGDE
jgi:phage terminase small subunit